MLYLNIFIRGAPAGHSGTNPSSIHEDACSIPGLAQLATDLIFLWLWHRPVATSLTRLLAWNPPFGEGVALKAPSPKKSELGHTFDVC